MNIWLPALLAFSLPLSTSALSILAILILLLWLLEGNFIEKSAEIFSNPAALSVLAFLAVLVIGLLWSPNVGAGLEVLQDRWKIAMLPVFLTAISWKRRALYINGFLAGLVTAMFITFLAWFDLIHYADVTPTHLTRKTFHVVYNPLLAFGIYLVLHEAIWSQRKRVYRLALLVLSGVMIFNMFITEGRAGQLVFFVLVALLLFQIFSQQTDTIPARHEQADGKVQACDPGKHHKGRCYHGQQDQLYLLLPGAPSRYPHAALPVKNHRQ